MATETQEAVESVEARRKVQLEEKEKESLLVIKQDVCQWLTRHVNVPVEAAQFMDALDTGVVLCDLARVVQRWATTLTPSRASKVPMRLLHCHRNAGKESFHARDNAANFINWCRLLGVEESLVFESEGLVLHRDERRVVLCLLEVARLASKLGLSPPQLVEMEQEIEMMEDYKEEKEVVEEKPVSSQPPKGKRRKQDSVDEKVLAILSQCRCNKKLHAVSHGSGKFQIKTGGSRSMYIYVRSLNDRVMVRVGGGWDTLDHFLLKIDPCRDEFTISAAKDVETRVISAVENAVASLPPRQAKVNSLYGTSDKSRKRSSRTPASSIGTCAKVIRTVDHTDRTPKYVDRTPAAGVRGGHSVCRTPVGMSGSSVICRSNACQNGAALLSSCKAPRSRKKANDTRTSATREDSWVVDTTTSPPTTEKLQDDRLPDSTRTTSTLVESDLQTITKTAVARRQGVARRPKTSLSMSPAETGSQLVPKSSGNSFAQDSFTGRKRKAADS